ncbi:MAG: PQQ-binding-like beta-propeller repeat protein [Meiothermus sp.]|nr:PQQ-binding-like beta-propeller repeat protein [Meiothermus sp.]
MRRIVPILVIAVLAVVAFLVYNTTRPAQSGSQGGAVSLQNPDPADWPMGRRSYDGFGYSPLSKLTKDNVGQLEFSWSTALGQGAVAATPIVAGGVLYLPQPNDTVEAFDAKTGDRLWIYARQLPKDVDANQLYVQRTARNLAIFGDKVYHATSDGYVIALEAKTGKLAWETQVGDYKQMAQVSGPLIVGGKVITGRACGAGLGQGCFIVAHDATSGAEAWKTSLVPKGNDAGWGDLPDEKRQQAGAWLTGSYDPELDLMFWGTSVPLPLAESARGTGSADLSYTNSTLALKPDTGEIVWSFQHLPRDNWGMDHAYERIVASVEVSPDASAVRWVSPKLTAGETRKVITGIPGKTGLLYTLDAKTGEFLWARETVSQNVISDLDKETGKPTLNEAVVPKAGSSVGVCPSRLGGKNWASAAYNPDQKVLFIPLVNACMEATVSGDAVEGTLKPAASDAGNLGVLEAISASTGKTLWRFTQPAPLSSVLATGGGLVFVGDANRRFSAFDAQSGERLWDTALSGPVTGTPITYAVGDKQFVAVTLGGGTDLEELLTLTPNLRPGAGGNALFVFALPDENQ